MKNVGNGKITPVFKEHALETRLDIHYSLHYSGKLPKVAPPPTTAHHIPLKRLKGNETEWKKALYARLIDMYIVFTFSMHVNGIG